MQNNTVTIELDKYNKLRDFKKSIESGDVCKINFIKPFTDEQGEWQFFKADKLDKIILEQNKKLTIALQTEQNNKIEILKKFEIKIQNIEQRLEDFKKYSIWQFIKWRIRK